jgi:hypothetical protein
VKGYRVVYVNVYGSIDGNVQAADPSIAILIRRRPHVDMGLAIVVVGGLVQVKPVGATRNGI